MKNVCETMRELRVSAKGPFVLLSILLFLPACVVSAPKVSRNDDIIRNVGNSVKDSSSYSEKNELEPTDESWYPIVDVSNDYYDQKGEDKGSREANYSPTGESETEGTNPTSSSPPKSPPGPSYTTFCEEELGSCPTDDDEDEDESEETAESIDSDSITGAKVVDLKDDAKSNKRLETKVTTNETSHLNSTSGSQVTNSDNLVDTETKSVKSEVGRDLEYELDCLIEDVELILQHAKEIIEASNNSHEHGHRHNENDSPSLISDTHSKETEETKDWKDNPTSNSDYEANESVELKDDVIEDEDLMESLQPTVHSQMHSNPEMDSVKDSPEQEPTQSPEDTLSYKKLEDLIKNEQTESHNTTGNKHHVKEHR